MNRRQSVIKAEMNRLKKGLLNLLNRQKNEGDRQHLSTIMLEKAKYNTNRIHPKSHDNVLKTILDSKEFPDLPFLQNGVNAQVNADAQIDANKNDQIDVESPPISVNFTESDANAQTNQSNRHQSNQIHAESNEFPSNERTLVDGEYIKRLSDLDQCNRYTNQMNGMNNESVQLGERFQVMCILGSGGCGEVYHALDTSTGKQVIIKSTLPKANDWAATYSSQRNAKMCTAPIDNEIKILQILKQFNACEHLFLPCYVDEFTDLDQTRYLITEAFIDDSTGLPAQDLQKHLRNPQFNQFNDRLLVYLAILKAVKYLNGIGIKHKDLKPANSLVNSTYDKIQIIDFGVACYKLNPCIRGFTTPFQPPGYDQVNHPKYEDIDDLYSLIVIMKKMFVNVNSDVTSFGTNRQYHLAPTADSLSTFSQLLLRNCEGSQSCNNQIDLAL